MRLKNDFVIMLTMVVGMFCAVQSVLAMDLVRDGQPVATLVVAENAPPMVRYAASELQTYIRKATGVQLPIATAKPTDGSAVVWVGESEGTRALGLSTADLGPDGFKIVARDNWLALFGRESKPIYATSHPLRTTESYHPKSGISRFGETGALFATYKFLEDHLGIRWYMPGELGEVVPKTKTVHVENLNTQTEPDFEYRNLYHADFPKDDAAVYWYRRAGFGGPSGIGINHSFHRFNKYKESHPEYYAQIDGKRDFNITGNPPGNFCLSEPGVLKQFVADIRDYFDKHPEVPLFSVMPSDGYVRICECPECQAQVDEELGDRGRFSNYVWKFVDAVAREIYKSHPDKLIGCCPYSTYFLPPDRVERLSPNVRAMICYARNNPSAERWSTYQETVKAWRQRVTHLYRWEYYCWNLSSYFMRGIPVFFPHRIAEDLRFLKGISQGEFIEAETWRARSEEERKVHNPGLNHLNWYVTGKLLWDTSLDVDHLLDEYYAKFYGPAHEPMRAFWALAEQLWMSDVPGRDTKLFEVVYTEDQINKLLSYLEAAISETEADSLERNRVELIWAEFAPLKELVANVRTRSRVQVSVPTIKEPPVIDGVLDDACWKTAVKIDFVDKVGEKAEHLTDGWLAWDENNLYLAFVNEEPDPSGMRYLAKTRDGVTKPYIWDDDAMEIFINTHPVQDKMYYQFIVNAAGTLWDGQSGSDQYGRNIQKWNSNFEAQVKIGETQWVVEMRIPFADIGIENPQGKKISANFYRDRPEGTGKQIEYTCWSPSMTSNHHRVDRFGFLVFEDGDDQ